jgi:hypothetical protein
MRDRELSLALLQLLPDLEHVQSVEDLLSWCYGHHCVGAEIACTALADSRTGPALSLLSGEPLWQEALEQLQRPPSERVGAINSSSFVVGPLAMGRHPLIDALAPRSDMPARARLLLAMLLDTVAVAYALDGAPLPCPTTQRQLHRGAAGRADTSRGPLFHFVSLDDQSRVQAWRVLAPTDWHVARDGLLQQLLRTEDADPQPAISVNAVDPCAPWRICEETSDEVADA